MKPTFLLCGGVGWCATNPLRYTLSGVCDTGTLREHSYLSVLEGTGDPSKMVKHSRERFGDLIKELLEAPVSLDSYITYYKKLCDTTDRPIIGDASNVNYMLPEEFMAEVIPELKKHFNVKAYMIFRDPVRRAWSHLNYEYFDKIRKLKRMRKGDKSNLSYEEFFFKRLEHDWGKLYIKNLEKFQRHVDTLPIVMEELWEGDSDTELELISAHIGQRVDTLYENVYSPDRGINKNTSNPLLRDQWCSDHLVLTQDMYYRVKNVFQPTYDAWENKFGSLPKYWGRPYDYQ